MSFVVAGVQTGGNGVNFGANLCGSLLEWRNYFECMKHDTHCVFVFSLQMEFTQRFFFFKFSNFLVACKKHTSRNNWRFVFFLRMKG